LAVCAAFIVTAHASNQKAEAQTIGNALNDFVTQPEMTGDWGGVRTDLKDDGVTIFGNYVSMFNANVNGGIKRTNTNAQQVLLGTILDLGKIAGIEGGTLHFATTERMGNSVSTSGVGNQFLEQTYYGGGATLRLMELSYGQTFDDKKLYAQIGFSFEGEYFAFTPGFLLFPSQALDAHPPVYDNSGWSDAPLSHWGGLVKYNETSDLYTEVGLWEVNPTYATANHGYDINFRGATGVIIPAEIGLTQHWFGDALPGSIKIGGYYDSSTVSSASGNGQSYSGRYGGYLLASQTIYRDPANSTRTLTAYFQINGGDARTAKIPAFYALGLIKDGTFPGRPKDLFGIGAYAAIVNPRAISYREAELADEDIQNGALQLGEYGINISYAFNVTPWLNFSPNFQYIINPGAFSYKHISNATVLGITTQVTF
jgi:porin